MNFFEWLLSLFSPKRTPTGVPNPAPTVTASPPLHGSTPIRQSNQRINKKGLDLIKEFEGLRLQAYLNKGDVPTIGWGHTNGVKMGDSISVEQAEAFLLQDVAWAEQAVQANVTVPLNQNQFSALVSWVFNVGPSWVNILDADDKDATFIKKLNQGDYDGVPAGLALYTASGHPANKAGLARRRQAEAKLFTTPV